MVQGIQLFRRLFAYDFWGNREALASLSTVNGSAEQPQKYFDHVVGSQRVWLSRFETPDSPSVEAWPKLSHEECCSAIEELHKSWTGLLNKLGPEKLDQDLVYRSTKGVEFRTPIQDVPMHLVMHSAYHRGQVASAVRQAGGKPAATDYVVYARQHDRIDQR
jgi:uncharacterized damage-inducible protein DinB